MGRRRQPLRAAVLATGLLALACAAKPQVTGPRSLGHGASIYKDSGELRLEYEYEPQGNRELLLHVEMTEVGGAQVGTVEVSVAVDGFDVRAGELGWIADVPARGTDRHQLRLHATHEGVASVTISSRHVAAGETVSTTTVVFRIHEHEDIRPCRSTDDECAGVIDE